MARLKVRMMGLVTAAVLVIGFALLSFWQFKLVTAQVAEEDSIYVVKAGDSLYSIAKNLGVSIESLAEANGLHSNSMLHRKQELVIPTESTGNDAMARAAAPETSMGEEATLINAADETPAAEEERSVLGIEVATPEATEEPTEEATEESTAESDAANQARMVTAAEAVATSGEVIYTVKAGDTLFAIARKFGVSIQAIAEANGLEPHGILHKKQELIIPLGSDDEPEALSAPSDDVMDEVTDEPTPPATEEPSEELMAEPTATATEEPTEEPTEEATEEATAEATEEPTAEAVEEALPGATPEPTEEAEEESLLEASPVPTEEATTMPGDSITATATVTATDTVTTEAAEGVLPGMTPEPTEEPMGEPTATATGAATTTATLTDTSTITAISTITATGTITTETDEDVLPGATPEPTTTITDTGAMTDTGTMTGTDTMTSTGVMTATGLMTETTTVTTTGTITEEATEGSLPETTPEPLEEATDEPGAEATAEPTSDASSDMTDGAAPEADDIVDTITDLGNFSTLLELLEVSGLTDTLRTEGPFTFFAPTDAAFAALPGGTVDGLLSSSPDDLSQILLYHMAQGEITSADLENGTTIVTAQGASVNVSVTADGIRINDANLTITDIETSNGVIHVIDAVLLPSSDIAAVPGSTVAPTSPEAASSDAASVIVVPAPAVGDPAAARAWQAATDNLMLFSPVADGGYHSPIEIIGLSRTFSGAVTINLVATDGTFLAQRMTQGGTDEYAFFHTNLRFYVTEPIEATLSVLEMDMADGSTLSAIETPLTLLPGQRFLDVTSPVVGQSVCDPIVISGYSNTFEANVVLTLRDLTGETLVQQPTMGGTLGTYRDFATTLSYTVSDATPLLVSVSETDASGRFNTIDETVIPVTFYPADSTSC